MPRNQSRATAEPAVLDARQVADVQFTLGRIAEQQQQWSVAMTIYRKLLEADPKQPEATHRLAILYDRQRDFEQSAQWFQKALKLKPGDPELFCDIGYSLYSQGRYGEAEINLRQAVALAPDLRRAQNHLGLVLAQTGRREEAFTAFRQAGCSPAEAHVNLALILALNDYTDEARQHLQSALSVEPNDREIRHRLEGLEALIADLESNQTLPPAMPDVQLAEAPEKPGKADHRRLDRPASQDQETAQADSSHIRAPRRIKID